MTDFELAAANSFKQNFNEIEFKGCYFNYPQSIRYVSNIGLKGDYINDEILNRWVNNVIALPVIPSESVRSEWSSLKAECPDYNDLQKFLRKHT